MVAVIRCLCCLLSLHGLVLNSHAHVQLCESWLAHGIATFQNFKAEYGGIDPETPREGLRKVLPSQNF